MCIAVTLPVVAATKIQAYSHITIITPIDCGSVIKIMMIKIKITINNALFAMVLFVY